jgi:ssDNA-binding Zn-finger/Zn-ribbon topoisomerase 1
MRLRDRILSWLPAPLAESIEADSRRWVFDCPDCHATSSIWEIGGVRWKAAGEPRRLISCPKCHARRLMRIHRPLADSES